MPASPENVSMAVFCDFENVALGVRDANYEKFDIKPILERLLLKGSIVVKKAYCDWDRYKSFKATMHEANFELIEIPHVRQSGKNSADIRLVVDALDLCYTKSHVNTFVIISGDSDFSPLVSKLRENAKQVIGVGVKQSTSDLLVANCDEFIFYDDLVRESRRAAAKREPREAQAPRRSPDEELRRKEELEKRKNQAIDIALETFDALLSERGDSGKIWASVLKEAIKRRKPDFSESYYGFRAFGNLLEEAQARGLLEFGRDEKSGAYVYRGAGAGVTAATGGLSGEQAAPEAHQDGKQDGRRRGRGGRKQGEPFHREHHAAAASFEAPAEAVVEAPVESAWWATAPEPAPEPEAAPEAVAAEPEAAPPGEPRRRGRGARARKPGARRDAEVAAVAETAPADHADATAVIDTIEAAIEAPPAPEPAPKARRTAANVRRAAGKAAAAAAEPVVETAALPAAAPEAEAPPQQEPRRGRAARKPAAKKAEAASAAPDSTPAKPAARGRRPRAAAADQE
jgi:uncharacterized LabA/DUF88 family protein